MYIINVYYKWLPMSFQRLNGPTKRPMEQIKNIFDNMLVIYHLERVHHTIVYIKVAE